MTTSSDSLGGATWTRHVAHIALAGGGESAGDSTRYAGTTYAGTVWGAGGEYLGGSAGNTGGSSGGAVAVHPRVVGWFYGMTAAPGDPTEAPASAKRGRAIRLRG